MQCRAYHSVYIRIYRSARWFVYTIAKICNFSSKCYPHVRNDVTIKNPQHVYCKQVHHVREKVLFTFHTLVSLHFVLYSSYPGFITFCFVHFIPWFHYILFCVTKPRRVAHFCNSVKKSQPWPKTLHIYATF